MWQRSNHDSFPCSWRTADKMPTFQNCNMMLLLHNARDLRISSPNPPLISPSPLLSHLHWALPAVRRRGRTPRWLGATLCQGAGRPAGRTVFCPVGWASSPRPCSPGPGLWGRSAGGTWRGTRPVPPLLGRMRTNREQTKPGQIQLQWRSSAVLLQRNKKAQFKTGSTFIEHERSRLEHQSPIRTWHLNISHIINANYYPSLLLFFFFSVFLLWQLFLFPIYWSANTAYYYFVYLLCTDFFVAASSMFVTW